MSDTTPIDPTSRQLDDPIQQERWSVTLDGISEPLADRLYDRLRQAGIRCHVQTVSPRVVSGGTAFMGVEGLYEVCVRKEDLPRAVDVAKELFPPDQLEDGRIWGPSRIGEEAAVLCFVSWHDAWDLAAELNRSGTHALVLPSDLSDPAPPEEESLEDALEAQLESQLGLASAGGRAAGTSVEDATYAVVVERPQLQRASEIGGTLLGERFHLDGSAYDA